MLILNAGQIRQAERAIEEAEGITSLQLMDRAVERMFPHLLKAYNQKPEERILFLCGTGNNGGDGLGLARLFNEMHPGKSVVVLAGARSLSPNTKVQLQRLSSEIQVIEITKKEEWYMPNCFFLVDALFGSGLNRQLKGFERMLVAQTQHAFKDSYKISIDIPSGVSADGLFPPVEDACIQADMTLSVLEHKPWEFLADQGKYGGKIIYIPLTEDKSYISKVLLSIKETKALLTLFALDGDWLFKSNSSSGFSPPPRTRFGHKGTYGHALLIGGSLGRTGAIQLSGMASLHTGSGLTTLALPDCGTLAAQTNIPEAMCLTGLGKEHISQFPEDIRNFTAIGIGPGMGRRSETAKSLHQFLKKQDIPPLVLDADALNILSENPEWIALLPDNTVLTPHPKEFDRMANGGNPYSSSKERLDAARDFAHKHKMVLVLKGGYTFILNKDTPPTVVGSGPPELATGGTGDVLTGIITSLLAQGLDPYAAAVSGCYLHGVAAQFATGREGNGPRRYTLTAGDVARNVGVAMEHVFG